MPDPQYTDAQLSDGRTLRFLGQLGPDEVRAKVATFRGREQIASNPPGVARPKLDVQMSPLGKGYQGPGARDLPGTFEGRPESLGDWVSGSAGEIGGGAADIARGNIARGAHRMISGAGTATLPILPFAGAAAPGALLRGAAGGAVGSTVGRTGAELLGADPDQSALAGDIGGLAGGWAGTKAGTTAPNLLAKVKAGGKLAAQEAVSHVPVAGRLVRRPSYGDWLDAIRAKAPVDPVYPGAPLPESPGEFPGAPLPEPPPPAAPLGRLPIPRSAPAAQTGEALGQPRPAKPVYPGAPYPGDPGIFPGAPLPEGPPPEAGLGRLPVPQAAPASQTGEALGRLPLKQQMRAPEAASPPAATPQRLQDLIQQGTGGRPLQPNVPLREQVKSSALQDYSYDAAAREFHVRGNDGTLYTYGDVAPEEAQAFDQAPSKGKAWQAIKQNPLVKKNGKPVIPTANRAPTLAEQIRSSGLPSHGPGAASAEEVARGEKFLRISPSGLTEFQGVSPDPTTPLRQNEAVIAVKPDGSWRLQDGNPQIAQDHAQRAIKAYKPAVKLKDLISE